MNQNELERNKKLESFLFVEGIRTGFPYSPSFSKNIHKLVDYEAQIESSFHSAHARISDTSARSAGVSEMREAEECAKSITKTASNFSAKQRDFRGIERNAGRAGCNTAVKIPNSENPYNLTPEQIEQIKTGDDDLRNETTPLIINEKGNTIVKLIPLRKGYNADSAFVDTIHFTFNRKMKRKLKFLNLKSDHDYIVNLSIFLQEIFGFGVTQKKANGLHNYESCYELGNNWGRICIGGASQKDSVLIILNGKGCEAAKSGWEKRLYDFLKDECFTSKITRIDLAFDDIHGEFYSVDQAREDKKLGLYTVGSRPPSSERVGDWDNPNGKGRTFYVGSRQSVRYMRIYEKGMQLGHKFHPWTRIELELKANKGLIIPIDSLLQAGAYLASQYPALEWISEHKIERLITQKESVVANVNRGIEITRVQSGGAINAIYQLCNYDAQKTIDLIIRREKIPDRFKINNYEYSKTPIHEVDPERGIYLSCSEILELQVANIPLPQRYYDLVEPKYFEECPI